MLPGPNLVDILKFLWESGPWGLLGAAVGSVIGLALGGPGNPPTSANGIVPATEWNDYVNHSWIAMVIGGFIGASIAAVIVRYVKTNRDG
jgi:hypothetical protein